MLTDLTTGKGYAHPGKGFFVDSNATQFVIDSPLNQAGNGIVIELEIGGKIFEFVQWDESGNKTLTEQRDQAKRYGFRLATKDEHDLYLNHLIDLKQNGNPNYYEGRALEAHDMYNDTLSSVRNEHGGFNIWADNQGRYSRGFVAEWATSGNQPLSFHRHHVVTALWVREKATDR